MSLEERTEIQSMERGTLRAGFPILQRFLIDTVAIRNRRCRLKIKERALV
jgi:hypothetical protein